MRTPHEISVAESEGRIQQFGYLTIKERLILRFARARAKLGKNWREKLVVGDPFFKTATGQKFMTSTGQAFSDSKRGTEDSLERVVVAMETIAGIEVKSIV